MPAALPLSPVAPLDAALRPLAARMGPDHLHRRLALEGAHESQLAGRGAHWRHLERWYSVHGLMRGALRLCGLHARGRRNVLRIQLRERQVALARLPAAFDGYTLLHLSDLHLDLSEAFEQALIARVRGLAYDACVLTGDYRYRTFGPTAPALAALARLRPHLSGSVHAVLGNHDSIRMVPALEALDVRVLLNESVALDRGGATLHLAGIDDAHHFRSHDLQRASQGIPAGDCAVLLSHTPEPYRDAALAGFDLMLCGHTHGGQICLPGGLPVLTDCNAPRAYARGAWRHGAMQGYTSVGCGSSVVDVRLNCLPEVTLHRLVQGGATSQRRAAPS